MENKLWMETDETARKRIEQSQELLKKVEEGSGLSFEAYLPPDLAGWVLRMVEAGTFVDPSEAIFVLMQESKELAPHQDLKDELLRRMLQAAIDDPRPSIPGNEVFEKLREKINSPWPEVAVWKKIDNRR